MIPERKRRGLARAAIAVAALAACAVAILFIQSLRPSSRATGMRVRLHPVVLANRTIDPASFGAPSAPESLSPRGTAAYALACAVPVTREIRALAESCGMRVVGYLPRQALLVEATPAAMAVALEDARFAGASAYLPSDKVRAGVKGGEITVVPLAERDRESIAEFISAEGGGVMASGPSLHGSFGANVSAETLAALARRGDVLWIDRRTRARLVNDVAVEFTGVAEARETLGLTGRGQVIATADSGLDSGDIGNLHHDFTNRVVALVNLGGCTTADYNGHGTHTAGTIGGSGVLSDGLFKGVAYEAELFVQACGTNSGSASIHFANADKYDDIFAAGIPSGAYIHSDSWGGDPDGVYDTFCRGVDDVTWSNPGLLVVAAAGNDGMSGATTVCSPGAAKNTLAVGNSYSPRSGARDAVNPSSSRGPCKDGRIKPDVLAPGTTIVSCRSGLRPGLPRFDSRDGYTSKSGTSMATPHVAGCAALVRQWLMGRPEFANELPSGALIKAMLTGGAEDIGNGYTQMDQGFGLVNLAESLAPSNRCVKLHDMIPFSDGSRTAYSFTLTNAAPFEAQLVWTDYPGTPSVGVAIVNDLDLVVQCKTTGETWYGNGVEGGDRTNTVESVRIPSAAPGEYRVLVMGETVPHDSSEGGAAALYVRGAFAEDDGGEEAVPSWNVTASVDGPPSLSMEGLSPSVDAPSSAVDMHAVSLTAPCSMVATNAYGTAVSLHALEGWTVEGVDSWTVSDDGTNVVISLVATNDVSVAWSYEAEPDSFALYFIVAAQDSYQYSNSTGTVSCYIDSYDGVLYNDVVLGGMWVARGDEVSVDLPGEQLHDEYSFTRLYYKSTGWFSSIKTVLLRSPFVLKLGAASVAETDGTAEYAVDSLGAMPKSLAFPMDGPKDVVGYYWDESRTVDGSSLPCWWYMRNFSGAGDPGLDDGDPDGDGFGNRTEYDEGTVPVDPMSFPFRVLSISPTNIVWLGGKTATYSVESAESLGMSDAWTEWIPAVHASGVTNSAAMERSGPSRFFRVRAFVQRP